MNYILQYMVFAIAGYFLGSILFAMLWGNVLKKGDITKDTPDGNPGTFNAFAKGGFWCGTLTVLCDVLKGVVPVFLCLHLVDVNYHNEILMGIVMLSPIIGHMLPIYYKFKGGKGIAVTFGTLAGYLLDFRPVLLLAITFIVFSVILVINPDYYKTMVTFVLAALVSPFVGYRLAVVITYVGAAIIVCIKLLLSSEEKKEFSLSIFKWKIIGGKEAPS